MGGGTLSARGVQGRITHVVLRSLAEVVVVVVHLDRVCNKAEDGTDPEQGCETVEELLAQLDPLRLLVARGHGILAIPCPL